MKRLEKEDIDNFIETQLELWPLAKRNFDLLGNVIRKNLIIDDFEIAVQCNPERIRSTAADVSKESQSSRACFLCEENRPQEQLKIEVIDGWDLCLNPYPIFPVHLTVLSQKHIAQDRVPYDIVKVAELLPGMVIFFNGAKAGASIPYHLHMQSVLKDELPLLRLVEKFHLSTQPGLKTSVEFNIDLPFLFFSGVIEAGPSGLPTLMAGLHLGGPDVNGRFTDQEKMNTFFWIDSEGLMRFIVIPRSNHRPKAYFKEGEEQRLVSPGCIDMAGVLVVPRKADFEKLNDREVKTIYSETGIIPNCI